MREALCVPVDTVRRTEDAFVDELFSAVPEQGGILVAAKYARTVADLLPLIHISEPARQN